MRRPCLCPDIQQLSHYPEHVHTTEHHPISDRAIKNKYVWPAYFKNTLTFLMFA